MVASSQNFLPRLLLAGALTCLCACTQEQGRDIVSQFGNGKPSELFQTSVDRLATLSMRDNLQSLYLLMNKLYLRNPNQWKMSGYVDAATAERQIRMAIEHRQPLPQLGNRRDLTALSYALSPEFRGDRGCFHLRHRQHADYRARRAYRFLHDRYHRPVVHQQCGAQYRKGYLDAQPAAGRQWGVAAVLQRDFGRGSNLSFAVEFGKIVARLDLLAELLDERYRRIGLNYAQSLLLMNFLPVQ